MKHFKVSFQEENRIYSLSTLVRAETAEQAKEKILSFYGPKWSVKAIEEVTAIASWVKSESTNYPYGNKRTSAFFSLQFKPSKGFRTVFQTVSPKTGKLNAEKYSTYSDGILQYKDQNGHFKNFHFSFNGKTEMELSCRLLSDFFAYFTPEEIHYFGFAVIQYLKIDAKATCIYKGAKWEDIKEFYTGPTETAAAIMKTGENLFSKIVINQEEIYKKCPEGFDPFRVTVHNPV